MHAAIFPLLTGLGAVASALPATNLNGTANAEGGDITIDSFQLYPENGDYDKVSDRVFFSVLYNASVAVFNPSTQAVESNINFTPHTLDPVYHASGIEVDPVARRLSVIVNAGIAFDTQGANVTGDNWLYKVDLNGQDRQVLWRTNLTAVTNGAYGGCQDAAHDSCGNTFVVCTYPGAIIKVSPDGSSATPWYLSNYTKPGANVTQSGLTGIVSKDDMLLAADAHGNQLLRFNKRDKTGQPTVVSVGKNGTIGDDLDGVVMPEKYGGKVLLVSSASKGTNVLVSKDGKWDSASHLGLIPSSYIKDEAFSVTTVQIRDRIYGVHEYFLDALKPKVEGTVAGPRRQFPLEDITSALDKLVQGEI